MASNEHTLSTASPNAPWTIDNHESPAETALIQQRSQRSQDNVRDGGYPSSTADNSDELVEWTTNLEMIVNAGLEAQQRRHRARNTVPTNDENANFVPERRLSRERFIIMLCIVCAGLGGAYCIWLLRIFC